MGSFLLTRVRFGSLNRCGVLKQIPESTRLLGESCKKLLGNRETAAKRAGEAWGPRASCQTFPERERPLFLLLCLVKLILGNRYGVLLSRNVQLCFAVENGANFFVVDSKV